METPITIYIYKAVTFTICCMGCAEAFTTAVICLSVKVKELVYFVRTDLTEGVLNINYELRVD